VQGAPEHVGDDEVQGRVANRARVDEDDVAGSTEVVTVPAGAVLAVAFEADSAYAAQRGAYTTVSESVGAACAQLISSLLEEVATTASRQKAAEAVLAATPPPPPASLVAARDEAARTAVAAVEMFDRAATVQTRSSSVAEAEPVGSRRSGLEALAGPAAAVACVALALLILRTGWRRAAAPVPA
jgi:hypothetical protein